MIGAATPLHFFTMGVSVARGHRFQYMIGLFLDNLDADYYENIFVVWSSELKDKQHHRQEC